MPPPLASPPLPCQSVMSFVCTHNIGVQTGEGGRGLTAGEITKARPEKGTALQRRRLPVRELYLCFLLLVFISWFPVRAMGGTVAGCPPPPERGNLAARQTRGCSPPTPPHVA